VAVTLHCALVADAHWRILDACVMQTTSTRPYKCGLSLPPSQLTPYYHTFTPSKLTSVVRCHTTPRIHTRSHTGAVPNIEQQYTHTLRVTSQYEVLRACLGIPGPLPAGRLRSDDGPVPHRVCRLRTSRRSLVRIMKTNIPLCLLF
jgi:hypothetical protein